MKKMQTVIDERTCVVCLMAHDTEFDGEWHECEKKGGEEGNCRCYLVDGAPVDPEE
jgi:hypothetical protein